MAHVRYVNPSDRMGYCPDLGRTVVTGEIVEVPDDKLAAWLNGSDWQETDAICQYIGDDGERCVARITVGHFCPAHQRRI